MVSGPEFGDMVVIVGVEASAGSENRVNERIANTKAGKGRTLVSFMQRTLVKDEVRCQSNIYSIIRTIGTNF